MSDEPKKTQTHDPSPNGAKHEDCVPALNKAREAFLETIGPICSEVDALDIALQHYFQVLEECGYHVAARPEEKP